MIKAYYKYTVLGTVIFLNSLKIEFFFSFNISMVNTYVQIADEKHLLFKSAIFSA